MLRASSWCAALCCLCMLCPASVFAEAPLPATVAKGAKLEQVFADPRFFEGPVWDPVTQKLYFTAFADKETQILRLDAPNKASVWMDHTKGINGMFLAKSGRLLAAQAFGQHVLSIAIAPDGPGEVKVLAANPKWHQPNDVTEAANGNVYFSDPDFKNHSTSVVYLLRTNGEVVPIIHDRAVSNGVEVSLDGKRLYISEDGTKNWFVYPIQSDGTVGPGHLFFDPMNTNQEVPDGLCVDEHDQVYLAGRGGVWVVDRWGDALGQIPVPEFCSNVAFGGADGKTLFLTCSKKVYSLQMTVRGGEWTRPAPTKP